jgi:hypothetical protein
MVRRRTHKRRGTRRVAGGARGYKRCIVAVIRRTKFKTPKAARKAFSKAAKVCRKKMTGETTAGRRRKGRKTAKRKCKYGRIKGGKRCRKTPVRRRR